MDEQSLNELLECSVCLERLNHTSKVLPCQHTFCRRCLDEILLTKQELRCPECRALIETKVEDLPNNILLIRLLEGLKTCGVVSKLDSEPPLRRRDNVSSTSSTSRQSNRQVKQPCAKALYDYEAKESGDLAFKKGEVVLLKKQLDDNWYQGELNSQIGFFPSSYVQVIVPLPQIPQCRALYDFDLKDEKEKDCLVFKKEDILTVMRRVDENWIEGRKGEKIGIFPLTFVELNDAAKTLVNSKPSSSILQAANKLPTSSPRSTSAGGTTSNTVLPSAIAASLPQQKRHSFTHTSHSSPSPPNPQRHSLELGSSGGFNILSSSVNSSTPAVVSTSSTSSTSNVVSLPTQRSESPDRNSPRVVSPPVQSSSPTSNLTTPYYLSVYNCKSMLNSSDLSV
ncbi:E3 ubiquitin-protein ligase SH3RF1 [Patella vulgata]|uniref:E3 ubiquitin-protein ligase SH3RF1 n=1 Tax=Patella vulgata TaxID=6465 RepID=UPI0024A84FC0|nr:E3 ubiquitin-protein ligase SH3RF1 [Patella vulgata]